MLTYFNIETYIVKRTKDVMSDARFHLNPSGHTQRSSEDRFDVNSKQEMYVQCIANLVALLVVIYLCVLHMQQSVTTVRILRRVLIKVILVCNPWSFKILKKLCQTTAQKGEIFICLKMVS